MFAVSGEVSMCESMMGKNKCESWNQFEVVFKPEGSKSLYCECLACHELKVTYDCMLFIIQ